MEAAGADAAKGIGLASRAGQALEGVLTMLLSNPPLAIAAMAAGAFTIWTQIRYEAEIQRAAIMEARGRTLDLSLSDSLNDKKLAFEGNAKQRGLQGIKARLDIEYAGKSQAEREAFINDQLGGTSLTEKSFLQAHAKLQSEITEIEAKELDRRVKLRLQKGAEAVAVSVELDNKERKDRRKFEVQTFDGLLAQFSSVRSKLASDNPFVSLFTQADDRMRQFERQFGFVPLKLQREFKGLSDSILSLDIFKADLAQASRLTSLVVERERLKESHAYELAQATERNKASVKSAELGAEARALSLGRDVDPVELARAKYLAISSVSSAERAQAVVDATQGLNLEQLKAANLLQERRVALLDLASAQNDPLGKKDPQTELAERQVKAAMSLDLAGKTDEQKKIAELARLEKILEFTNIDFGKLTPELRAIREKSIDRRIELSSVEKSEAESYRKKQTEFQTKLLNAVQNFTQSKSIIQIQDLTDPGTISIERITGNVEGVSD